jgi:lipoprotein-releasing system permease protein
MYYEFFIGKRHLTTTKRHAFTSLITILSILGIIIGVMALITVLAVMSGFESEIRDRILSVQSHITLSHRGAGIADYEQVVSDISTMSHIKSVLPFAVTQVMFRSAAGVTGGVLKGINPKSAEAVLGPTIFKNLTPLDQKLRQKNNDGKQIGVPPGIILGRELAATLGVIEGDPVYVVLSSGGISPVGHMPAVKRFEVTGIFEIGMYEYDAAFAYINLTEAMRTMHIQTVNGIEIEVDDLFKADVIADRIVAKLGGYPYFARDWMSKNHTLFSALKLEKQAMFIILTLIILVAAFNIASSLIMIVTNKRKEIGILKAMGATKSSIRRIFVMEGMIIGATGTVLGVLGGLALCFLLKRYEFIKLASDVYYITTLPVQVKFMHVGGIVLAALGICFMATIYPANHAATIDPVEAIRYG